MARRLNPDEWEAARVCWESDLTQTDESIAASIGMSKAAVVKRRIKEQWQRVGTLQNIQQRAQLYADSKSNQASNPASNQGHIKKTVIDAAVKVRADVLDRHRADWSEHRKLFTLQSIAGNFDLGKSAKITAEMLKIRQDGERKAYGFDDVTNQPTGNAADALAELARKLPC